MCAWLRPGGPRLPLRVGITGATKYRAVRRDSTSRLHLERLHCCSSAAAVHELLLCSEEGLSCQAGVCHGKECLKGVCSGALARPHAWRQLALHAKPRRVLALGGGATAPEGHPGARVR